MAYVLSLRALLLCFPCPGERGDDFTAVHELEIVANSYRPVGLMTLRHDGRNCEAQDADAGSGGASLGLAAALAGGQEWSCTLRFENATSR